MKEAVGMKDYGSDKKNVVQANLDAQKIAFAPIMFQAAKSIFWASKFA